MEKEKYTDGYKKMGNDQHGGLEGGDKNVNTYLEHFRGPYLK